MRIVSGGPPAVCSSGVDGAGTAGAAATAATAAELRGSQIGGAI
jgi:hypothetical protein